MLWTRRLHHMDPREIGWPIRPQSETISLRPLDPQHLDGKKSNCSDYNFLRMVPNSPAECAMCEQYWKTATISSLGALLLKQSGRRPELLDLGYPCWRISGDPWRLGPTGGGPEWQLIFTTLWVIWNHRNEVVFRGRTPSADAVVHEAGGLVLSWNRVGLGLSAFVPL